MKVFIFAFIFLLVPLYCYATEPIPYKDFLLITDKVFDALDQVEAVFMDKDAFKIEARSAIQKYSAALKKYDLYIQTWPEGIQGEIAFAFELIKLYYESTLSEGLYGGSHTRGKYIANKARELFRLYKDKGGQGK